MPRPAQTLRGPGLPCLLLAAVLLPGSLQGQVADSVESCPDGRVVDVVIDNQSIFDEETIEGARFAWALRLANRLHIRTRAGFVRRELLLSVEDCYEPFRVADSERILRRYPFISQAEVFGVRRPDGDWVIRVETEDEWTTLVEAAGEFDQGFEIRSVSVSEENFLGRGMLIGGFLEQKDSERLIGARFATPRLFNSRLDFRLEGGTTRPGSFLDGEIVHPFLGEVGDWAMRLGWSRTDRFFQYSAGEPGTPRYVLLPLDERIFDASVARRFGEPGDLLVAGIGVSRESLDFTDFERGGVEIVEEGSGFEDGAPATPAVLDALRPQTLFASGTRINLLFAHRAIRFVQRSGLDALQGVADLEVGSEVGLTLGRTIASGTESGAPDDLYTRIRLYAAGAPAPFTLILDTSFEARQLFAGSITGDGWRDLLAEFDLLAYWQPGGLDRHTFFGRLSGVGGWQVDQPFQLTLGGRTGVRGYHEEDYPGARRVSLQLEDRIYLGWPAPRVFDLGLTAFADVGRIWDGDVPFGTNSGWRSSVGAGLRVGIPSETRGVVRIDLAWAVESGGLGSPILRISTRDMLGFTAGLTDPQLARTRRLVLGADRFGPAR